MIIKRAGRFGKQQRPCTKEEKRFLQLEIAKGILQIYNHVTLFACVCGACMC
jgi:hypothetical protein